MTPDDLQEFRVARLKDLIAAKFQGQNVSLGRALGHKSGAFVRQLVDQERPITEKTVLKLHELPGCAGWFDQPLPDDVISRRLLAPRSHQGSSGTRSHLALVDSPDDDQIDVAHSVSDRPPNVTATIQVPLLAVRASMGPGAELQGEEEMVRSLSLSPQWISTALRPSRAEALRFIHGHGDSMAPTFNSGDVLLVDTDIADVNVPGVYVLEAQDQLFIKRVNRRLDGEYEISSDNPAHRTVEVLRGDHDVAVKGRVIWVWNGRKM